MHLLLGVLLVGKDVTFTGTVPMQAYFRETAGPNDTKHLDMWEVRNRRVITSYDIDMTKIMHMIVVSDDLTNFRHVHPVLQPNGHLLIDLNLPQEPGGYHRRFGRVPPKVLWQTPNRIPKGYYLLLGDNRTYAIDSHTWGFVQRDGFVGVPVVVMWPLNGLKNFQGNR